MTPKTPVKNRPSSRLWPAWLGLGWWHSPNQRQADEAPGGFSAWSRMRAGASLASFPADLLWLHSRGELYAAWEEAPALGCGPSLWQEAPLGRWARKSPRGGASRHQRLLTAMMVRPGDWGLEELMREALAVCQGQWADATLLAWDFARSLAGHALGLADPMGLSQPLLRRLRLRELPVPAQVKAEALALALGLAVCRLAPPQGPPLLEGFRDFVGHAQPKRLDPVVRGIVHQLVVRRWGPA